jgi:hypothetical protein
MVQRNIKLYLTLERSDLLLIEKYIIQDKFVTIYIKNKKGIILDVIIDLDDLDIIKKYSWFLSWQRKIKDYYVTRQESYYDEHGHYKQKTILLHREITKAKKGQYVDHHNHNSRDNRKENLIVTTNAKNSANRNGANKNSSTGVRNVNWGTNHSEYWVQFCRNNERFKWKFLLDKFNEACEFAKEKRIEIFGEFAGKS